MNATSAAADERGQRRHPSVQEMFAAQVRSRPGTTAIDLGTRQVTYGELQAFADGITRRLQDEAVPHRAPVPVYTSDGVELIAALLGVLQAGCAFVWLDPTEPVSTCERKMMATRAAHVLVGGAYAEHPFATAASSAASIRVIPIALVPRARGVDDEPFDVNACAYIVFTTRPGHEGDEIWPVAGRLAAIDHFVRWQIAATAIGPGSRIGRAGRPHGDALFQDVFVPLCAGATVCMPPSDTVAAQGDALVEWLDEAALDVVHGSPALMQLLPSHVADASRLPALRHVLISGEPPTADDIRRWCDRFGQRVQLTTLYGHHETTIAKFAHAIAPGVEFQDRTIGAPLPGAAAFVLDDDRRVCPPGRAGELYVRTPYRALGYYRRPDLLDRAFTPNPFTHDPNDLLHRTGRRARVLADGRFVLLDTPPAQTTPSHVGDPRETARPSSDALAPLSFAQQRLWFLDQLEPGRTTYVVPLALKLAGPVDVPALHAALAAVVQRHDALRMQVRVVDGEPMQEVLPIRAGLLTHVDLRDLAPAARARAVAGAARELGTTPFVLERGPLLRLALVRVLPTEHVLLMSLHHIVADGWSVEVFIRELAATYEAAAMGLRSSLQPLPVRYADYAVWQREWIDGPALAADLAYWRTQLAAAPALELPTDRPRPTAWTHRGAVSWFEIDARIARALIELGHKQGATLFMVLLAALDVLLRRHTGQADIVVGTPISGRMRPEFEPLIGLFLNTLPLRSDLSGNPTYLELLRRVRATALDAFTHQGVPFERIVEEVQPERDPRRTPVFQVFLAVQRNSGAPARGAGVTFTPEPITTGIAKFDLSLYVDDSETALRGGFEYSTELFDEVTIARLTGCFLMLLREIATDPGQCIDDISLLNQAARRQILVEWNDTTMPISRAGVHELIEAQVDRTPDAVALVTARHALTFAEVNARANQLARHLRAHGVGIETSVAICLDRGESVVVALLAVMKAGAAYVPLDPAYPQARLRLMLEDVRPAALVTTRALRDRLPDADVDAAILLLDADAAAIAQHSPTNLARPTHPEELLYILYTSGSTGRPKGTAVSHRLMVNLLTWHWAAFRRRAHSVQYASLSFDVSVFETVASLGAGEPLWLIDEDARLDMSRLAQALADRQIDKLVTPIVVLHRLAEEWNRADAPRQTLRDLIATGEALEITGPVVELCRRTGCALHNYYGPTETHWATAYTLAGHADDWPVNPSIGRPIANTQAYVLDAHLRPVPIGVTGELFIGGAAVARGYLHRPAFTAARFIPDPYGLPGGRLYRTGDVARWSADGTITYLGRADDQVKLRGYRIEPGEVAAALREHHDVSEAAVIVRADEKGERRLVAYVVGRDGLVPAAGTLRAHLQLRLPEYMIPAAFVALARLPLSPNGKIDRHALPVPSLEVSAPADGPRTPMEELLAVLWAQVLGTERVGRTDDFFMLGGHSLLAMQVIAQMRRHLGIDIAVRELFERPTVTALAEAVDAGRRAARGTTMPPLRPQSRPEPAPLSYAQQRLWFLEQLEPGRATYHIPIAMRLTGSLDAAALATALAIVIARHESLRMRVTIIDGEPAQVIEAPRADWRLSRVDVSGLPASARTRAVTAAAQAMTWSPFDLINGPLLRAALITETSTRHVLLITLHHLVGDGWSMDVLLRELGEAYAASTADAPAPFAPITLQYSDYARWQRDWLTATVLDTQLSYWRGQLAGLAPFATPTDRPRPALASRRGAIVPVTLCPSLTERLRAVGRQEGATLYMVLMAAYQVVLGRWAGRPDVAVATSTANRPSSELEPLIGFFINTLVLRTSLAGNPTGRELLARIRETCLDAYAHQDLPFERLVEELNPPRDAGRHPLTQVQFEFINTSSATPRWPGVSVSTVDGVPVMAKFDLTLLLQETADGLEGALVYATDLYTASSAERLVSRWQRVLEALIADPACRVVELPLTNEEERTQLLTTWNLTDQPTPAVWVHELFEAQAAQTPDAIAISSGSSALTYAALDGRANQLAAHLRACGIGPEVRVAVCLTRCPDLIVGLLGILKAGAAYVPIDPGYPVERIAFMLEDARTPLLLTSDDLEARIPAVRGTQTFSFDREWGRVAHHSAENAAVAVAPSQAAYVIYTSGSTGRPKGVVVTHEGLANYLHWARATYPVGELGGPVHSSVSFDLTVTSLYVPLLSGGRLVLLGEQDVYRMGESAARRPFDLVKLTPSHLQLLATGAQVPTSGWARALVIGGEALSYDTLAVWRAQNPAPRLFNEYGPTETVVGCCVYEVAAADPGVGAVPIGRPIGNTRLYVLDAAGHPAPIGFPGELYIGGVGVARGYLHRPGLTASRFVPDPFNGSGARLYRTGDRVRWRMDGQLEYLGRVDDQVKIRGYRIEPAEIAAALREHGSVADAVVVARNDNGQDARLVAYFVARDGDAPSSSTLREHLATRVPDYMVPSAYVALADIPLTPNGKVDRGALSIPQGTDDDQAYEAPRTAVEELMASIWAAVLGVERVGRDDDFFELGGHSLLATQVVAQLQRVIGVELDLQRFFDAPALADVAAAVEAIYAQRDKSNESVLDRVERDPSVSAPAS